MTAENPLGEILELVPKAAARRNISSSAKLSPAYVASWRASSYDLLNGLSVRDLSDKMPTRIFNALFSDDVAVSSVSGRKQR